MRNNNISRIIIILLLIVIGLRFCKTITQKESKHDTQKKEQPADSVIAPAIDDSGQYNTLRANAPIDELTKESVVVAYVKKRGHLPKYYITKKDARQQGWDQSKGNLCEVLPGRAIGGDIFTNREGSLPEKPGRKWYEADLNYNCTHRNADRLLFSDDGLLFVTKDHYKTFVQK